ncbi:Uncharacterised protein [Bordetella pertussis]|nr:Uncharacterised protein [Bordetella pertussis]
MARATWAISVPCGPASGSNSNGRWSASSPWASWVTSMPSGCARMMRASSSGRVSAKWAGRYMAGSRKNG